MSQQCFSLFHPFFSSPVSSYSPSCLCDGVRCCNSVLYATLQLSNHYISINAGRLPHRQGTTSLVHRLSRLFQLITAHHRFPAQVRGIHCVEQPAGCSSQRPLSGQELFPLSPAIKREEGLKDEREYGCCYYSYHHWQYPL